MKTQSCWLYRILPRAVVGGAFALTTLPLLAKPDAGFIVHEWGTFTSVQGKDGVPLEWRPLKSADLPGFVHDWRKPGPSRQGTNPLLFNKGDVATLQRMETPVIYFYADEPQVVSASVSFPSGLLTEWYPQASQIGPSTVPIRNLLDCAGVTPTDNAQAFPDAATPESRARWDNIRILPAGDSASAALPSDNSPSHYFAARDTDANELEIPALTAGNASPEREKFIFYRGVGNFRTPLRVTAATNGAITLANLGSNTLTHLFVLGLENRSGNFLYVDRLNAGECRSVQLDLKSRSSPLEKLSPRLGEAVAKALVDEGLYPKEAAAMVHTWEDSWFAEDGLRVLYTLPQAWTEETLPLTFKPAPRKVVRVMVGRAEVLAPERQDKLATELAKARSGDSTARQEAIADLKGLGRFAEPALRLATRNADPLANRAAWELFQVATARQ